MSNKVHRAPGGEIPEFGITLFLMQWGQFTDHDITLTPIPTGTFFSEFRLCITVRPLYMRYLNFSVIKIDILVEITCNFGAHDIPTGKRCGDLSDLPQPSKNKNKHYRAQKFK